MAPSEIEGTDKIGKQQSLFMINGRTTTLTHLSSSLALSWIGATFVVYR